MYYIYKIENKINHKKYIGLTNNIARRRNRHFSDLRRKCHDNSFLQKEFNIYGETNFTFNIEYSGDITDYEIGEKEKEYIKYYDSYKNGYNQNEGGNFGATNGGSHLIETDILSILSVLEFQSKPGQVLADMFGVSRTTISRIKQGINHNQYKEKYEKMSLKERKELYKTFCESTNFIEQKVHTTIIKGKRHLDKTAIFMILYNKENNIIPRTHLAKKIGIKSTNTIICVEEGKSYKDYALEYTKLTNEQKNKIASLLSD